MRDRTGDVAGRGAAAEQPADHRDRIAWSASRFRAAPPAPRRPDRTAAWRRRPERAPGADRCPAPSSGRGSRPSRCVGVTSSASRSPSRCDLDHRRAAADLLHQRADVVERPHRRAVDRGDAVAFGQHAPGRPTAGSMRADDRRQQLVARRQADGLQRALFVEARGQPRQAQRAARHRRPRRAHAHRDVLAVHRRGRQRQCRFAPGRRLAVADGQQRVAAARAAPAPRCPSTGRRPARNPAGRSRTSPTAARRTAAGWRTARRRRSRCAARPTCG